MGPFCNGGVTEHEADWAKSHHRHHGETHKCLQGNSWPNKLAAVRDVVTAHWSLSNARLGDLAALHTHEEEEFGEGLRAAGIPTGAATDPDLRRRWQNVRHCGFSPNYRLVFATCSCLLRVELRVAVGALFCSAIFDFATSKRKRLGNKTKRFPQQLCFSGRGRIMGVACARHDEHWSRNSFYAPRLRSSCASEPASGNKRRFRVRNQWHLGPSSASRRVSLPPVPWRGLWSQVSVMKRLFSSCLNLLYETFSLLLSLSLSARCSWPWSPWYQQSSNCISLGCFSAFWPFSTQWWTPLVPWLTSRAIPTCGTWARRRQGRRSPRLLTRRPPRERRRGRSPAGTCVLALLCDWLVTACCQTLPQRTWQNTTRISHQPLFTKMFLKDGFLLWVRVVPNEFSIVFYKNH